MFSSHDAIKKRERHAHDCSCNWMIFKVFTTAIIRFVFLNTTHPLSYTHISTNIDSHLSFSSVFCPISVHFVNWMRIAKHVRKRAYYYLQIWSHFTDIVWLLLHCHSFVQFSGNFFFSSEMLLKGPHQTNRFYVLTIFYGCVCVCLFDFVFVCMSTRTEAVLRREVINSIFNHIQCDWLTSTVDCLSLSCSMFNVLSTFIGSATNDIRFQNWKEHVKVCDILISIYHVPFHNNTQASMAYLIHC